MLEKQVKLNKDGFPTEIQYFEDGKLVARLGVILDDENNFIGLRELEVEGTCSEQRPRIDITTVDFIGLINWINTINTIKTIKTIETIENIENIENIGNIEKLKLVDTITEISNIVKIVNEPDTEIIVNKGFETGVTSPWIDNSLLAIHTVDGTKPHNGSYSFHWEGSGDSLPCAQSISLHQNLSCPLYNDSDLSLWMYIDHSIVSGCGYFWIYVTIEFDNGKKLHYILWKTEPCDPPPLNPCAEDGDNGTFDLSNIPYQAWYNLNRNLYDDYMAKFEIPVDVKLSKISVCSYDSDTARIVFLDDVSLIRHGKIDAVTAQSDPSKLKSSAYLYGWTGTEWKKLKCDNDGVLTVKLG